MNDWIGSIDFSIFGAALLLSVIGLWFTVVIPGLNRWDRRFFTGYFLIFLLCCLSGIVETLLQHHNVPNAVFIVFMGLETLLLALPPVLVTVYMLHCCAEDIRSSKLFQAMLGLLAAFVLLLVSVLFMDGIVYFTPDNQYHRGPLYPLLLVPMLATLLLNLAGSVRRQAQLSHRVFLSCVIAQVPMTVATIVQLFVDFYSLLAFSYVFSALVMYSSILSDQIEQDLCHQREIAEQQREIAHARASVMVLQMRPHFIYNTLVSIHNLCRLDPRKAQQVTEDFTNYLRRNFNAVANDSAIPFTMELEHARAYLAVEQAQLDDMLIVDWDTPFTRFRLPPLTLQPIVENAVKHGMDPYAGPLRVSIQTRHTDDGTEIIVEDNGKGFDPDENSEPGIALKNIRQRLEMMCGGSLTITPGDSGGTRVTIRVPLKNEE